MKNLSCTDTTHHWLVERHSGRSGDQWRTVYIGKEDEARRLYQQQREALRQGTVRLFHTGDTAIVAETSAPRLRTRW